MGRLSVEAVRRKLFNYTKRLRDVHFLTKEEAEALVKVEAKRLGVEHPRIISQVFEKAWESQKREPFARTQVGNAQRFVAQHGTEVRYCHGKNTWFIWDGQRWAEDRMNSIQEKAKETVERILVEAENVSDEDEKKELRSWWSRSQTSG
jgi:phage/plasmid-associated DNA primase